MKVVVQRVKEASVKSEGKLLGEIGQGLLLLVGFTHEDTMNAVDYLARKISKLRIFTDEAGKLNRSVKDMGYEILSISQFTLYGDALEGNRPSFTKAMEASKAEELYQSFNQILSTYLEKPVQTGQFGAYMDVSLINDGPVTILLEYTK